MSESWGASVFDRLYDRADDPWDFQSSPYEHAKYDATVAALPERRFAHALEIGCSIGVLTARLAERCDRLLALDLAEAAVARARRRCGVLPGVEIRQACIPRDWPDGAFDLILISEVLYFLSPADIAETSRLAHAALAPGGTILLVNWTGPTDTPTTGEQAATLFMGGLAAPTVEAPRYRIDMLPRKPCATT